MEVKRCSTCGVEKPISEFYIVKNRKVGCGSSCKRGSSCKICAISYSKESNQKHPNSVKIRNRRFYLKNKERIKQKTRDYQMKNKSKVALYAMKHEEKKRGLQADLTVEQWETIKRVFRHRCVYCGKRTTLLEKDHVIPLSRGGALTLHNIVPACRSCNASKSANPPDIPVKIMLI